jgi:hypothetical protein
LRDCRGDGDEEPLSPLTGGWGDRFGEWKEPTTPMVKAAAVWSGAGVGSESRQGGGLGASVTLSRPASASSALTHASRRASAVSVFGLCPPSTFAPHSPSSFVSPCFFLLLIRLFLSFSFAVARLFSGQHGL